MKMVETVGLLLVPDEEDPSRWKRIGHLGHSNVEIPNNDTKGYRECVSAYIA